MESLTKKHHISKLNIFFSLNIMLSITIKVLLYILNNLYDIFLISVNLSQDIIGLLLNIFIVVSLSGLIWLRLSRYWLKMVMVTLTVVLLVICFFIYGFGNDDSRYYYFTSSDKSTTLIVEENSWLLSGWSNFFIKENGLFARKLKAYILTDDGYRPFESGNYSLTWLDQDTVKIEYGFGSGNIIKTETIKMK